MSWLRIDDGFARHPKIEQLTDHQFRVWIGILCYCAEYRNGGLIYKPSIGRSVSGATPALLMRLVALELLDPVSGGNHTQTGVHFQVHDWHKYNHNSDPAAAERMRRYRQEHPRVQGGKWERTREAVYERDGGVCIDCGQVTEDWNADHEPNRSELAGRGLSIYDPTYIYTRCHSCHSKKTRTEANRKTEPTPEPTPNGSPHGSQPLARVRPVPSLKAEEPKPAKQAEARPHELAPVDFAHILEQAGNETHAHDEEPDDWSTP